MPRRLLHIPKGLLKLAFFLLILGFGVVVALIRTQAGRDVLAQQIEAEFDKAFMGQLKVGRLYGDVLRTLYATNVTVSDPEGRTVISIDTVGLRLGVLDGLRRDITIDRADLIRPRLTLVRSDSAGWNLERALERRSRESQSKTKWEFRSADVAIVNASIVTMNTGQKPAAVDSGLVFDYTNARLDDFRASATIDWSNDDRLIDLRDLHASFSNQGLEISSLRTQFAVTDSSVAINEAELTTPSSHFRGNFQLTGLDSLRNLDWSSLLIPKVVFTIDDMQLDSAEVTKLFPANIFPDTKLQLALEGSSNDLRATGLVLEMGSSSLEGFGRVRGWPDSASYTLEVSQLRLRPEELGRFIPSFARTFDRLPDQQGRIVASGAMTKQSGTLTLRRSRVGFEIDSDLGLASGELGFVQGSQDSLDFDGQLVLFDYDASPWSQDLPNTVINGEMEFRGSGTNISNLMGDASISVRSSRIRGMQWDTLAANVGAGAEQVAVSVFGTGRDGTVQFDGGVRSRTGIRYGGRLRLIDANLAAPISGRPQPGASAVSSTIDVEMQGSSLDDMRGIAVAVIDTAVFFVGKDTMSLSPSQHRVTITHNDSVNTQISVSGDVLEGSVGGRFSFSSLISSADLWLGAVQHTVVQQRSKLLHKDGLPALEDIGEEAYTVEQERLRSQMAAAGLTNGMELELDLRAKRLRDFHQIVRAIPPVSRLAALSASIFISPDSINVTSNFAADSIRGEKLSVDAVRLNGSMNGAFSYSLDSLSSSLTFDIGTLEYGAQRLEDVALNYYFDDQRGEIHLTSSDSAAGGLGISLDASLAVLPGWNEVNLADVTVRKDNYVWSTYRTSDLKFFGDAVDIGNLVVRSAHENSEFDHPDQELIVKGVLSGDETDTLLVDASFVRLDELSALAKLKHPIGGELHSSIRVAHALRELRAAGNVSVSAFSFEGRDLGDLAIRSVYSSPSEGLTVDVDLTQPREKKPGVQRNDISISGRIRPPGIDDDDNGNLDLQVEVAEIDLFFFEYLFPNELAEVSGEGSGSGFLSGDFSKPIFNASFELERSSFLVPEFNLRFGITGPLTVDEIGFHLQNAVLSDPTGGRADLRGSILFNDYRFFSFDLAADLSELMIMNVSRSMDLSFYGQVWVSGSATLTGPLQRTLLRSSDAVTSKKSRLYLPVTEDIIESDNTFIVFADSTGEFQVEERDNILSKRPQTERAFVEGMDMSFNILIPEESAVFLVFDPLLGDVINALGSGRVQLQRREGDFSAFGTFTVESGDYLFTAGEVFQRRFILQSGGTITWDGDAIDARFDIPAWYRTRASLAGLPGQNPEDRVPIRVDMSLTGRVTTPLVDLRISLDQDQRDPQVIPPGLESALNQADLAAEYATSVLLTNTFLLTSNQGSDALTNTADDLLFHSLSELVSSQLNRFVSQTLNLDVNVGVQQGRNQEEYDVIYGFALRLDDQRVVIRGEGLYETGTNQTETASGIQGAFVVEYRLTPAVQLEFFFRRESDLYRAASSLGTAYGVGIVYQTDFPNWHRFGRKLRGLKEQEPVEPAPNDAAVPASD